MKKAIIAVVLIFGIALVPSLVSAQTWGVNVGFNSATFGGDDGDNWESKTGFMFGGLCLYPLTNTGISLHIEANYTMKGASFEGWLWADTDGDGYADSQIDAEQINKLAYLEIPVLFQYNVKTAGSVQPIFYAGPALALKLSSKYTLKYSNTSDTESLKDIKSMDISLVVGGGVCISGKYYVSLRYTMGVTNYADVVGVDLKNNVISGVVSVAL